MHRLNWSQVSFEVSNGVQSWSNCVKSTIGKGDFPRVLRGFALRLASS